MNKKFLQYLFFSLMVCFVLSPVFSFAADPSQLDLTTQGSELLAPCPAAGCGWNELIGTINKTLNFILFKLAIPIAAIMFCYAGFKMVLSVGNPEAKKKAKEIATGVVIGLIYASAAWLIIHLVLDVLGYDGSWIGF